MEIINYNLDIDINSIDFTYKCHEIIKIRGNEEKLILNSVNHNIKKITVNKNIKGYKEYRDEHEIIVDGIITSDAIVEIDFTGKIPEELEGIYVAKLKDGFMVTTQFEPTGARKLFLCVDNPEYKSTFDISVTVDGDLDAISNMPVENIENNGRKRIKFLQTPRMSTYLLYLGVGKFEEKSIDLNGDKQLILLAPKGHLTPSDYPLEIGKKSIEFYEEYFKIKYPLPKEHLISVPEFAAGAMENWGAITFREIYLNMDSSTSTSVKRTIAEVIAHELAHQWFGDLVTMKWWNDLWLNESFATFMSYKTIDKLYPDYDMFSDFLITETSGALAGDSLVNSHPIEVDVKSPDDIAQIFDEISYGKGGSILRMINTFVTDEVFRKGLNLYLENFKYRNAEGSDLWEYIGKISDLPVRGVMGSFIKQAGYPLINVWEENGKIIMEQSQFLLNGKEGENLWKIPLTIKYSNEMKSILFDSKKMEMLFETEFIKLNDDESGFYRVLYSENLYENMIKHMDKLTDKDLWGVINDYFSFLLSGKIDVDRYIEIASQVASASRHMVDHEIANELFDLSLLIPEHKKLRNFSVNFLRDKLSKLGEKNENEEVNISILRGVLSYRLSILDRTYASELYTKIDNISELDPDIRSAVFTSYAIHTNDFEKLEHLLSEFSNDEDKIKIIQAMSWLNGEENLAKVKELTDNRKIKLQDSMRFFITASLNPEAREYLYNNFEEIINKIQSIFAGSGYSSRVVEDMVPYIGLRHRDEIGVKLKKMEFKEISRGIKKGLEYLEIYSAFISRNK